MKKCSLIIAIAFAFISCFKSDNRDLGIDYSPDGYLRYDLDRFPYEYTGGAKNVAARGIGVYAKKQLRSASVGETRYILTGQIGTNKQFNIVIITDSLKTGTYTTAPSSNAVTSIKVDSILFKNNRPVDFLTVNISNYSQGIIEGTLSGKLSAATTVNGSTNYQDASVANGVFKNVSIQYP